jgi:hypothetical protein
MTLVPPQAFRKTAGIHRAGTAAARPAAADVLIGSLYFSTDTGVLERSDGAAWASFAGTVPTPLAASTLVGRGSAQGSGASQPIALSPSFQMTGTALTVRSGIFDYTFNSTLTEPPTGNQVRLNTASPWTDATKLWMTFVSADDQDLYWGIMITPVGSTLLMQDQDDHTRYGRFVTTGVPIDKGAYAELPIAWRANAGTINTASRVFLRVTGPSAPALAGDPVIVALAARVAALEAR